MIDVILKVSEDAFDFVAIFPGMDSDSNPANHFVR
jgi:hypothetical protein